MNASVNWASYEMPVPDPRSGLILRHFHEFWLDDGPSFHCDGDIGQMNRAVRLLLHTSRSSCRGRCCQPLPSRPPVWRFLVDRHHCLSNILPGSSEMAQDPQTGCTNVLAIWESYVAW